MSGTGNALFICSLEADLESYRRHLEAEGFIVTQVGSAEEAIRLWRAGEFDLVLFWEVDPRSILDPVSMGLIQKAFPQALYVRVSTEDDNRTSLEFTCQGAVDRLQCPFEPAMIISKVAALNMVRVRNRALERENEKLRREAIVDELTGIPNRRFLSRQIENELSRSIRYTHPFSFLLLDLDNFKLVNDQFGHDYGDRVLIQVAHILSGSVRSADTVARYGGDEFAILLLETDIRSGQRVAERLRQEVVKNALNGLIPADTLTLTASVGLCNYPQNRISDFQNLVHFADAALYSAKRSGGNQVALFLDPDVSQAN